MLPSENRIRNGLLAIRVSSGKQQRDGDSPEEQRQRGESLARSQNINIIDTAILVESASHTEQPMQEIVERCKVVLAFVATIAFIMFLQYSLRFSKSLSG